MKRSLIPATLAGLLLTGALPAQADDDMFTGDVKLACEAILCLSSGQRPEECTPSLNRYFSITAKKWSDTVKGRLNFLNLCPTASYDNNMKSLVNAIANGAGRCDADYLNRTLAHQEERQVCPKSRWGWDMGECTTELVTVISNSKPAYCMAYDGHSYTYKIGATYVGDPYNGGHWE